MRGALVRTVPILACLAASCGGGSAPSSTAEADPLPATDRAVNAQSAGAPEAVVTIGLERLDVPEARGLKGKRVGLIANGASVTSAGTSSAAALRAHGIRVVRLFAPEHGLSGRLARGERVKGRADVVSLY